DAGDIDRSPRRYARAWLDWSVYRTDCAFGRLAVACGLDTRSAETRGRGWVDGRRLRRYARRWLVERSFAWVQWQRRILVRWEYYRQNFLGFVQLACLIILFRRF